MRTAEVDLSQDGQRARAGKRRGCD
jgi:hypothetical protein